MLRKGDNFVATNGRQKTLYLTENVSYADESGDIQVPPPMLLVRIPIDYTGQVTLNYTNGKLGIVEKNWKERHKPIELTEHGFNG